MIIRSALKKRLLAGETVFGTFVGMDSVDAVEIIGLGGFDFVILDMEHAPGAPNSIMGQVRAAELRGMDVLVRLPCVERTNILRALDMGISGALAPQVNDLPTARAFVEACLYPPLGCRGFAGTRASFYGSASIPEYIAEANSDLLRIIQCETEQAVREIDSIASLEGVDLIFIGPYDLSLSLGVPGDKFHPKMAEAVDKVLATCKKFNKPVGIFASSPEEAEKRLGQGFTFMAYSMDAHILAAAVKNITGTLRSLAG
jgi:4-hydroxy-2-oxoheptanedioate aldolase